MEPKILNWLVSEERIIKRLTRIQHLKIPVATSLVLAFGIWPNLLEKGTSLILGSLLALGSYLDLGALFFNPKGKEQLLDELKLLLLNHWDQVKGYLEQEGIPFYSIDFSQEMFSLQDDVQRQYLDSQEQYCTYTFPLILCYTQRFQEVKLERCFFGLIRFMVVRNAEQQLMLQFLGLEEQQEFAKQKQMTF